MQDLFEELGRRGALTLAVKVIPKSARNQVTGRMADGTLKVRVAAPADKGKANVELCAFLAGVFRVPSSHVTIAGGVTSARKLLRVVK